MTEDHHIFNLLEDIQTRSGLRRTDGNPLYLYRTTSDELELLRGHLKDLLFRDQQKLHDPADCAGFCLFAAEQFRRSHTDGPWKWETIIGKGLNIRIPTMQNFHQATITGMKWWHLGLITTEHSRRFLVTLACQGGLPLRLLRKHGGHLRAFFSAVLRDYERYPDTLLQDTVSEHIYRLPPTLDNDEVNELTCRLIRAIGNLRAQSKPAEAQARDRIDYLKAHHPNWTQQIPVDLDDEVAEQLLHGLLRERTEPRLSSDLSLKSSLVELPTGRFVLARELDFEKSIRVQDLANRLEVNESDLPARMNLYLEQQGRRLHVANVARTQDDRYRLHSFGAALHDDSGRAPIQLVAMTGTREIATVHLPGGSAVADLPWVFVDDERHSILGYGSVKTRRASLLVAIPKGFHPDSEHLESICQIGDRDVVRITQACSISDAAGTTFTVEARAENEDASFFELRGTLQSLGIAGSEVYVGLPHIEERTTSDSGHVSTSKIEDREIRWRPHGTKAWRSFNDDCLGDVTVQVFRHGAVAFQTRAKVYPVGFRVRLLPSTKPKEGQIVLEGLGKVKVQGERISEADFEMKLQGGRHVLLVKLNGERPPSIKLRIHFRDERVSDIKLPCPAPWIGIVDSAGYQRAVDGPIPIDELDGLRLQVIASNTKAPKLASAHDLRYLSSLRKSRAGDQFDLPLSFVRPQILGLLASEDLDNKVELRVIQPPGTIPLFRFNVSSYVGKLDKELINPMNGEPDVVPVATDHFQIRVGDDASTDLQENLEAVTLSIFPMGHPEAPVGESSIGRIGEGIWRFDASGCEDGAYLAVASLDGRRCLRPLRISVRMDNCPQQDIEEVGDVEQYEALHFVLNGRERRCGWERFVQRLAENPGHPGWDPVKHLLNSCRRLPVSTFETVTALTRNSVAIANVGFQRVADAWLWEKLEQLQFMWALVPIQAWCVAITRIAEGIESALVSVGQDQGQIAKTLSDTFDRFCDAATIRWGGMECVLPCIALSTNVGFPLKQELLGMLLENHRARLREEWDVERTKLISTHETIGDTRETWPNPTISTEIVGDDRDLFFDDNTRNRWAMLNGPTVAAAYAVKGESADPRTVSALQELRGVDPSWFESAYRFAIFTLAGRELAKDQDCFRPTN